MWCWWNYIANVHIKNYNLQKVPIWAILLRVWNNSHILSNFHLVNNLYDYGHTIFSLLSPKSTIVIPYKLIKISFYANA